MEAPVERKRSPVVSKVDRADGHASWFAPGAPEKLGATEVHKARGCMIEEFIDRCLPRRFCKPLWSRKLAILYCAMIPTQPRPQGT